MENYQELFTKKWSPTDYVASQFDSGQAAVDVGGVATLPVKFNWGLTPMPKVKTSVSNNSSDSFIVSNTSKNKATAAAVLGALTAPKTQLAWHVAWGSFPAQQSVIKMLPSSITSSDKWQLIAATAKASYGSPKSPGWFEYFNQMNTTVKNIALGANVKTALNSAAASIDKSLAKYKK
jgi:multiple sugar transport system substrate-binding protein